MPVTAALSAPTVLAMEAPAPKTETQPRWNPASGPPLPERLLSIPSSTRSRPARRWPLVAVLALCFALALFGALARSERRSVAGELSRLGIPLDAGQSRCIDLGAARDGLGPEALDPQASPYAHDRIGAVVTACVGGLDLPVRCLHEVVEVIVSRETATPAAVCLPAAS